jgi:hypothetical protein
LVARILHHLGRSEEALSIAESVPDELNTHPAVGPKHIDTLNARNLVAQTRDTFDAKKFFSQLRQSRLERTPEIS